MLALTMPSCHRNNNAEGVKLEFSADTVMFDTVFTTITSSTRSFIVRNTTGAPVEVDIALAGGKQSYYSINVDGVALRCETHSARRYTGFKGNIYTGMLLL